MSVYVDGLFVAHARGNSAALVGRRNGHQWCHMVADTSAELEAMALRIGLKTKWLQNAGAPSEHYDLTPRRRAVAVAAGAIELDKRGLVEIIRSKRAALTLWQRCETEGSRAR